jgi:hypothetical protein
MAMAWPNRVRKNRSDFEREEAGNAAMSACMLWPTVATLDKNPGTETTPRCAVPRKHIDRGAPEA